MGKSDHADVPAIVGAGLGALGRRIHATEERGDLHRLLPAFPEAALQKVAVAGLTVFNDCIVRAAFTHGLPLLDLRLICTEEEDYANPIEPSTRGSEKIAGDSRVRGKRRHRRQDRGLHLSRCHHYSGP